MNTNDVNQENVKALVKLGIEVKDMANVYINITEKGHDISKQEYINNLTELLKFFQTRNKGIDEEIEEAVYKEDVLEMLNKNKKIISLGIDKRIKPICDKLDSYYFMTPSYTNKLIKSNPNIFNINKIDLEIYSVVFSNFVIKTKEEIINLYEYAIKQQNEILNQDIQTTYQRLMHITNERKSKWITKEDLSNLLNFKFMFENKEIKDETLKQKYELPKYTGEDILIYREKILKNMEN